MTATLKTTIIQEPSSATANITLDTSGGVTVGQNLTVSGSISATGGITGAIIRSPQFLTSGTSYTTPAGCTRILVEAWGGGGGGGGASGSSAGGGGGAGSYAIKYFTVTPSTSYTYAIGAAGTAGAITPSAGGNGGNTTFTVGATTLTAGGGVGGATGATGAGGAGGTATNADFNFAIAGDTASNNQGGNGAGSAFWGGVALGKSGNYATQNGKTYGAGGGGGSTSAGGTGFQGIIKITEFG